MVIVVSIYLRFYTEVGVGVSKFLWTPTPPKIPSNSDSTACLHRWVHQQFSSVFFFSTVFPFISYQLFPIVLMSTVSD
jgi:hypothetical protein